MIILPAVWWSVPVVKGLWGSKNVKANMGGGGERRRGAEGVVVGLGKLVEMPVVWGLHCGDCRPSRLGIMTIGWLVCYCT